MLRKIFLAGVSAGMLVMISPGPQGDWRLIAQAAAAGPTFSISTFYDRLTTDGDWVSYHGADVFVPDVDDNWRPYTVGHWVNTRQYGWLWVSNESFGWATYHYGRWAYGDDIGWYWVPGTRWAPAWVSWRRGGNNVIWAPLPPSRNDDDLVSIDISYDAPPDDYYVVVPTRSFLSRDISTVQIRDDRERIRYVDDAEDLGRVRVQNNIVINNILNVNVIERGTSERVPYVDVRETDRPDRAGRYDNNAVSIFNGNVTVDVQAKPRDLKDPQQFRETRGRPVGDRANSSMNDHAPPTINNAPRGGNDQGGPGRRNNNQGNNNNQDNGQQTAPGQENKGQTPSSQNSRPGNQTPPPAANGSNDQETGKGRFKQNDRRNRQNQQDQTSPGQRQGGDGNQATPGQGQQDQNQPGRNGPDRGKQDRGKRNQNNQGQASPDQGTQAPGGQAPASQDQGGQGNRSQVTPDQGRPDQGNTDQRKRGKRPGAQNDNQAPDDQSGAPRRRQKGPDQAQPGADQQLQQDQPSAGTRSDNKNRRRQDGNGGDGGMNQQAPGGDSQGRQGGERQRRNQPSDNGSNGDARPERSDQGGRNRPDAGGRNQDGGQQKPERGNRDRKGGRGCDPQTQDCSQ